MMVCSERHRQPENKGDEEHSNYPNLHKEEIAYQLLASQQLPPEYTQKPGRFTEFARGFTVWWLRTLTFGDSTYISPEDLEQELIDQADVLIIDARRKDEYEVSRIYSAIHVGSLTRNIEDMPEIANTPKDQLIVTYCACGLRSGILAKRLNKRGWINAKALLGGLYGWVNNSKPIVTGHPAEVCYKVKPQHLFAAIALKNSVRLSEKKKKSGYEGWWVLQRKKWRHSNDGVVSVVELDRDDNTLQKRASC